MVTKRRNSQRREKPTRQAKLHYPSPTHPLSGQNLNLNLNLNVMSWASCVQRRELIKLFFIRQAGRRVGWQWRYILQLHHNLVCLFMWRTCKHMSRPCRLWTFCPCVLDLDPFAVEFWDWEVIYLIVLPRMMSFKCSFRPARSLFISYFHEHDRLGEFMSLGVYYFLHYLQIIITT